MLKKGMQLHPKDNVVVVLEAVKAGDTVVIQPGDGTLVAREDINFGHKLALVDIGLGEEVVKYGNPHGQSRTGHFERVSRACAQHRRAEGG